MRLIDADVASEDMLFEMCGTGYQYNAMSVIDRQPTADAEPVVHGQWITKTTSADAPYTICSHCNTSVKYNDEYGTVVMNLKGANYCPNCGAKMDEVSE